MHSEAPADRFVLVRSTVAGTRVRQLDWLMMPNAARSRNGRGGAVAISFASHLSIKVPKPKAPLS